MEEIENVLSAVARERSLEADGTYTYAQLKAHNALVKRILRVELERHEQAHVKDEMLIRKQNADLNISLSESQSSELSDDSENGDNIYLQELNTKKRFKSMRMKRLEITIGRPASPQSEISELDFNAESQL